MKKELLKKAACFGLLITLCIGTAGCGKQKVNDQSANGGEIPENLKIYAVLGSKAIKAGAKTFNDTVPFQLMEEKTGCHVDWVHPANGAEQETFNLMIASGDLPDMIVANWQTVPGGVGSYASDDIIIPLTDLIEKYMPNLSAFNKEHPEIKKQYTLDDGEIYYIPFIRKDPELKVYVGPQIRKDWLDKLGLSVPTTSEELYEVLKAFKEKDPNGNGEADEIPMSAVGFEDQRYGLGCLTWSFGAPFDFYIEDGKVKYGALEDSFVDGLKFITKLYSEGLIDSDYLLNDRDKMDGKFLNDKVGFVYSFQPTKYYNNMKDTDKKVEGIAHLKGANGKQLCFHSDYGNDITTRSIVITTANKNPEGTAKWLDAFFGEEGSVIMNFGKEGESFEYKDDFPTLIGPALDENKQALYLGTYESLFPALQDWRYYKQILSDWGAQSISVWSESGDASGIMPQLSFTEEEQDAITRTMAQVDTYVLEAINKTITGGKSADEFGEVQNKLRQFGIDKVLEIYNDAYDRYQKR